MENQKSSFMANVSDDLLFEILLRLPHGRSAIQCSLVCKRWASFIFSDYFKARFDHRHHQSRYLDSSYALPFGLLLHYPYKTNGMFFASYELSSSNIPAGLTHYFPDLKSYLDFLPQPFSSESIDSITSGDDLFLIDNYPEQYFVCNPLTKQWNLLPPLPPNSYPLYHGLWRGYTNQNAPGKGLGSYKVIMLDVLDEVVDAFIFCSESGEWRQRTFTVRIPKVFVGSSDSIHYLDNGVTSDGVVYFPVSVDEIDDTPIGFLSVNPIAAEGEECRFVQLPDCCLPCREYRDVCFGVVRGRLRISLLVKNKGHLMSQRLRVWELREQALAEWILVHNKDLQRDIYVAAFHPNNGDVIFVIEEQNIFKLIIGEGEYEKVGENPDDDFDLDVHSIVHTSWNGLPLGVSQFC